MLTSHNLPYRSKKVRLLCRVVRMAAIIEDLYVSKFYIDSYVDYTYEGTSLGLGVSLLRCVSKNGERR
jgi:hypothetical protein